MDEQSAWRLRYLGARVEAAERATEVLALLVQAQDTQEAVARLSALLRVDQKAAQGVLDNWGPHLTRSGRAEASRALAEFTLQGNDE